MAVHPENSTPDRIPGSRGLQSDHQPTAPNKTAGWGKEMIGG
jgi:hypothetical protein